MLFWCFIISYIIETINFNKAIILSAAIVLAILPIPAMPLRLTSALQYFPFYYAGTLISRIGGGKPLISNRIGLLIASIIYLLLQVISYNIPIVIDSLVIKILSLCAVNASKVGLGFSGIGIAFFATGLFLEKGNRISPSLVILSTFCYGVYIFHQFILKALYYHSPLTDIISPVYLPWICFIITVTLSLLLSFFTLKTRLGRFLIG